MGADGSIVIAKRADFKANCPGVEPHDLNLYSGEVLGVDAVWGYFGDNLYEPNYVGTWSEDRELAERWEPKSRGLKPRTPDEIERVKAAAEWFSISAEVHEVWT